MKKLLLIVIIGAVAVGAWKLHSRSTATTVETATSDARLLTDRIWIDRMPRNERDTINAFALISEHSIGMFHSASMWKGAYEGFRFEVNGDEVRAVFPQSGDKEKFSAKARPCKEGGMDFCLDISGNSRGVKRYYSREGWEIQSMHDEQHFIANLTSAQ